MTGDPGVGKTTIVKAILRILTAKGVRLLLCAPTGAPAGDGGRRLAEIGRLCRPPPAADGEADGAGAFGGKLKAAGGGHGQKRDLGDNGGKPAVPQAFLETDEERLLIARLDIDHAVGHEPGLREGRGEQILPNETPEHPATQPRGDSRRKERRGRAVDRAIAAARHLMQRAERQSASRQMPADRLETEGQHQSAAAHCALEAPDALAKLLGTGTGNGRAHVLGNGLGGWYVPYLFSLGEESQSESDEGERTERLNL
jgi:hypothetical protein